MTSETIKQLEFIRDALVRIKCDESADASAHVYNAKRHVGIAIDLLKDELFKTP